MGGGKKNFCRRRQNPEDISLVAARRYPPHAGGRARARIAWPLTRDGMNLLTYRTVGGGQDRAIALMVFRAGKILYYKKKNTPVYYFCLLRYEVLFIYFFFFYSIYFFPSVVHIFIIRVNERSSATSLSRL